jgi:hypothetical protein
MGCFGRFGDCDRFRGFGCGGWGGCDGGWGRGWGRGCFDRFRFRRHWRW